MIASRSQLTAALKLAASVADRKSAMPLLGCVLLRSDGKRLSVSATDLVVSVTARLPAQGEITACAQAKDLSDLVSAAPSDEISIDGQANHWLAIKSGRWSAKLAGIAERDFPRLPTAPTGTALDAAALAEMIERVAFSVCSDESRFHLTGALLEADGATARMVTTDGHRLSKVERAMPGLSVGKALIPGKGLAAIRSVLSGVDSCALAIEAGHLFVSTDDTTIAVKLIDAAYPPYDAVIPKGHANTLTINRDRLLDGLHRASLMASDTRGVKLSCGDVVTLTSVDPDKGDVHEELDAEYDGAPLVIGFNPRYMADWLRATDAETVTLKLGGELDPGLFSDGEFLGVVMPMRV